MNKFKRGWISAISSPVLFLSVILSAFSPFPIGVTVFQFGWFLGLVCFSVGLILVSTFTGPENAVLYSIVVLPVGVTLGLGFAKKWRPDRSIFFATLMGLLFVWVVLMTAAQMKNLSLEQYLEHGAKEGIATFKGIYEKRAHTEELDKFLKNFEEHPEKTFQLIKRELLPNLFYFFALLAWVNAILMNWYSRKLEDYATVWSKDFLIQWRSPDYLIWITIASGAALIFNYQPLLFIAEPLFKILILVYFLQGISILAFFFDRFKVVAPIRILGYLGIILFAKSLAAAMGFFDLWWDIRKKIKPQGGEKNESDIA